MLCKIATRRRRVSFFMVRRKELRANHCDQNRLPCDVALPSTECCDQPYNKGWLLRPFASKQCHSRHPRTVVLTRRNEDSKRTLQSRGTWAPPHLDATPFSRSCPPFPCLHFVRWIARSSSGAQLARRLPDTTLKWPTDRCAATGLPKRAQGERISPPIALGRRFASWVEVRSVGKSATLCTKCQKEISARYISFCR